MRALHTEPCQAALFVAHTVHISEGRGWGVGSVVIGFRIFGAPRFTVQRSQKPFKKVILGPLD